MTLATQPVRVLTACGTDMALSPNPLAELLRHPLLADRVKEIKEPTQFGGITVKPGQNGFVTFIAPAEVVIPGHEIKVDSRFQVGTEPGYCLVHMKGRVVNHDCRDVRGMSAGPSCSLRSDLYEAAVLGAIRSKQSAS